MANAGNALTIGPLQDPVTWYGINYTGTQMTQWYFQNKGKSRWTGKSSFVLEVPLRHLRPSVIYSVPCDWILQRALRCCVVMPDRTETCVLPVAPRETEEFQEQSDRDGTGSPGSLFPG